MSKKTAARPKDEANEFDDSAYENVLVSATFDYNQASYAHAALLLAPRAKQRLTFASLTSLILMLFCAWNFRDNQVLLYTTAGLAILILFVWSNWERLQGRYARSSTLGLAGGPERRHVVVCDDAVHVQSSTGASDTFPLSDLRTVRYTDEHLVAGFGSRRYVYVPRRALSEGRYRKLATFLSEHSRH